MKNIVINGQEFRQTKIKYFAVNGNPNHKVWASSKKEAEKLAPIEAKLVYLQSEIVLSEV